MNVKRLQKQIAGSRRVLLVTIVCVVMILMVGGLLRQQLWLQLSGLALSIYLMFLLDKANVLLRIYSQLVPSSFLVLVMVGNLIFPSVQSTVVQVSFVGYYLFSFSTYQDSSAAGYTFYAYVCIGIASTVFIQILFFVPLLCFLHKTKVLSMSRKSFWAALLGLLVPYWFMGVYAVYKNQFGRLIEHFTSIVIFQPFFDISVVSTPQLLTFSYISLLAFVGISNSLGNRSGDKIRTRMFYEMFSLIDICCMAFIILQPQHFDRLLPIMIVTTAPLIAHFFAFANTTFNNMVFQLILGSAFVLTVYNLYVGST
ncbi:hypothetical protein HMPREF9151_00048 [Hoylesella saccharolytica F0055]|uniref:Tat pathway signal sequence domain protein n=1 Tax=Hoylesella saccharolytica F0055 TaxID=1127699 RepID=L1NL72_9BACT|nr:hypothetical protein [Hoylesella saccharolytica]EKY04274.1 hypothetical protein HMPREF9151_00048 [Hoylesella saccharolytica F0055]